MLHGYVSSTDYTAKLKNQRSRIIDMFQDLTMERIGCLAGEPQSHIMLSRRKKGQVRLGS